MGISKFHSDRTSKLLALMGCRLDSRFQREEQSSESEQSFTSDERAMQLLSGELGGPNIMESVFRRDRDGILLSEKLGLKSKFPKSRGVQSQHAKVVESR